MKREPRGEGELISGYPMSGGEGPGVADVADLLRFKDDGDEVEAGALFWDLPAFEEVAGGFGDALAFDFVHGAFRVAVGGVAAAFDLDEDEGFALPGDEVDFAAETGADPVAFNHGEAFGLEEAMGEVFGPAAQGGGFFPLAQAGPVAELVADGVQIADQSAYFTTSNSNSITLPRTTKHR